MVWAAILQSGSDLVASWIEIFNRERNDESRVVEHSYSATQALEDLVREFSQTQLQKIGECFKRVLDKFDGTEFKHFQMLGVSPARRDVQRLAGNYRSRTLPRSADKLDDLVRQSKVTIAGKIVSLNYAGTGWEEYIASLPTVTSVRAYELPKTKATNLLNVRSTKAFKGREKVWFLGVADLQSFGDGIPIPHDVLVFDAGESDANPECEAEAFNSLLLQSVMRIISDSTSDFILKVLTPWHPETLTLLRNIQRKTGKGAFYRSIHSKNSTLELYFISSDMQSNLEETCRELLKNVMESARKSKLAALGSDRTSGSLEFESSNFERPGTSGTR